MLGKVLKSISLVPSVYSANRYVTKHSFMGREFDVYGRQLGRTLLAKGKYWGAHFLMHPVSCTRYWEFPFVLSCLPSTPQRCLDVSSPNLFSLFYAQNLHPDTLIYINPDKWDTDSTQRVVAQLGIKGFQVEQAYFQNFISQNPQPFDAIWSISVIEHIDGDYTDIHAARDLYRLLAPGGRLILTLPTDKTAWDEYRSRNEYGLDVTTKEDRYFFQRFYTHTTVRERIIESIGQEPSRVAWYGEKNANHFHTYIQEWQEQGLKRVIQDASEFSRNYREYETWEAMPGVGVCGLLFEKPL